MRRILYVIIALFGVVLAINNFPQQRLASIEKIDNELAILFRKNCEYSSMSLSDVNGVGIASITFSETMGEGPIFLEDSYLPIAKAFKIRLKKNTDYQVGMTTDCLGNNQVPVYRLRFKAW